MRRAMARRRKYGLVLRAVGYAMSCVVAAALLVGSGLAYVVVRDVSAIGGSHAIKSGRSIGAQNILLMGLESRTYWNGTVLPWSILKHLHAGSRNGVLYQGVGGNATNTLILIHIFAGGRRAVGFSIPRDDWVTFADTVGPQQTGKIDQAYGVSMYYEEANLRAQHPGMSKDRLAFLGNEAGRAAAVATVEKLTGVHIDHFAEVNLFGFYELAKVLGGVEVCLNHAVYDSYSGANFKAGYQHLDASQALAFVRQRHGLPNGDLDRTHRQQAFLDSVLYKLRSQGVLGDLSKIQALLTVARQYVITDSGWNLLNFAAEARGLTSSDIVFHTLPITQYSVIGGQDVNLVDPSYIKAIVTSAFQPASGPTLTMRRHTTVDVFNGSGKPGLGREVLAALTADGYQEGTSKAVSYHASTSVLYGSGALAGGRSIAEKFKIGPVARASVPAHHVWIVIGANGFVPNMQPTRRTTTPVAIPTTGAQGGAVTATNGISCVN